MSESLWSAKDQKLVELTIEELVAARQPTGWPWSFAVELRFRSLSKLAIKPLYQLEIMRVLGLMIERGKSGIVGFAEVYRELVAQFDKRVREESVEYDILWPIAADIAEDADLTKPLRVLGFDFRIISAAQAAKYFTKEATFKLALRSNSADFRPSGHFFVVRCSSISHAHAWAAVEPPFMTLRGLIEWTHQKGARTESYPARVKSWVPHPQWALSYCSDNVETIEFLTEPLEGHQKKKLTQTAIEYVARNASVVAESVEDADVRTLVARAFRLYADALDHRSTHMQLLGWWRMAEAVTVSESVHGDTRKIVRRLGSVTALPAEELVHYVVALEAIADQRNDIVHRGATDEAEESDANLIKVAAEGGLSFLLQRLPKLKTCSDLEALFELKAANKARIESMHRVSSILLDDLADL